LWGKNNLKDRKDKQKQGGVKAGGQLIGGKKGFTEKGDD